MKRLLFLFAITSTLLCSCGTGQRHISISEESISESTKSDTPPSSSEESKSSFSSEMTSISQDTSTSSSPKEDPYMVSIPFAGAAAISGAALTAYNTTDIKDSSGNWVNSAHDNGLIISPYYSVRSQKGVASVFATRTTYGAHSFTLFNADRTEYPLTLDISSKNGKTLRSAKIIGTEEINPTVSDGKISFSILKPGNYTILVNGKIDEALTIFAYEHESFVCPQGYSLVEKKPGDHGTIRFNQEKTAMVFKKGVHRIDRIELCSNTMIYFEDGAQIEAKNANGSSETPLLNPDWAGMTRYQAFLYAKNAHNIKIHGHAFIDLTKLDWHMRLGAYFEGCSHLDFDGFILNNSPEWTMHLMHCDNSSVSNCAIFGYRQNSDGFAVVDSNDVTISDCFARSGDDLFEVKTMDSNLSNVVQNIRFERCVGWPDKCRGFGIIHETARDIKNVTFSNIKVVNAPADWMDALGALVVIVAGNSTISGIRFENVSINSCSFYPINLTLAEESNSGTINDITFSHIAIPNNNAIRLNNAAAKGKLGNIHFDNIIRNEKKVTNQNELILSKNGILGTLDVK